MERRLAAILAADLVGYSRLVSQDEAGTVERLKTLREDILEPLIAGHRGRVVKLMGDGLLVEFASIVDAVACALAWQDKLERETGAEALRFRIGINLGDVLVDGDDIHGDGVNLAARLEALAQPGGVCVSAKVYEEVRSKVDAGFEDLGLNELKNIAEPVRVFQVQPGSRAPGTTDRDLALPEKPSIAVLPLTNMSADPEQDYFADGITEDIITELSRFPTLFVIARNSAFRYKDRPVDAAQVGKDLGVHYLVEGSVRRAGNRVRITAQLVEAGTGNHLWAERYDRGLEDIFALQDEVARTIVSTVEGRLADAGAQRARSKPVASLAAYDCILRADQHLHRWTKADVAEATSLAQRAIAIDPKSARAHFVMGMSHYGAHVFGTSSDDALDRADVSARTAMALDDDDSKSHILIAHLRLARGDPDGALNYAERAVALNPSDATAGTTLARALTALGQHGDALEWIDKAMRLDPFHADWMFSLRAEILYAGGRYDQALTTFKKIKHPPFYNLAKEAACYAQLDRHEEARVAMARFRQAVESERHDGNSRASLDLPLRQAAAFYRDRKDVEHWLEGYANAGLTA